MTTVFCDPFSEEVWTTTYKDHTDKTVDDTLMRVAAYVASAEQTDQQKAEWKDKFFDLLSNFKCTAGGRIYANAGTEYGGTTMMNCFSPDVKVVTNLGLKNICDVKIGDLVLTHKGRYRPVVNLLMRQYTGPVERVVSSYLIDDIVTTPEHPFYQGTEKWTPAEKISTVITPFVDSTLQRKEVLDIAQLLGDIVAQGYIDVSETQVVTTKTYDGPNNATFIKRGQPCSRFIPITENFGYLIGRFVGDGCTFQQQIKPHLAFRKDGFNIAFNATTETKQAEYIISLFEEIFGIKPNLIVSQNNTLYVRKASLIVSTVLDRLLGGGFDTKFIPKFIWNGSIELKLAFLRGLYDADGFITSSGFTQIEMTNPSLIEEIHALMTLVGMPSTRQNNRLFAGATSTIAFRKSLTKVYEDERLHINSNKQPTTGPVRIKQEGHLIRVKHTQEDYNGIVYNLSVEEDESYVVNNAVVHNCFVSPRPTHHVDSLPSILQDILNQCQTLKAEGGWGQNFSWIRPRGTFIKGIGVETPGAVKYMEIYDKTSDVITAGSGRKSDNTKAKSKIRKGAMMAVLDVWHPDIIEFITAKQQPGRLTKFNVSVNCTDQFMQKVIHAQALKASDMPEPMKTEQLNEIDQWNLRYPDVRHPEYDKLWTGDLNKWEAAGLPTVTYRTVSATWLWNLIMESTYNRAEPGVLFLDRANYFGPLNYLETIYATNPCGEQTLAPGGVCNLGSLNLTQFINSDRTGFDLEALKKYARYLVRFLDNINDLSMAPLPEYLESMRKKRRIGVGILGWGSALFMLKVRFGSEHANELREQVMSTIAREAYMASIDLAEEKGMFEYCIPEKHAIGAFVKSLDLPEQYMDKLHKIGIRNSSLLSIQPTGNTSILANVVSGGLEPVFMPEYVRTVIVGEMPDEIAAVTPKWFEGAWHETEMFKFAKEGDEQILRGVHNGTTYKIDRNRGLTKEVLCQDYSVREMKARNEWDPNADWAVTTTNLEVKDHINDLTGFARWVDSAMSKTVNVPNNYSFDDFQNIYLQAYQSGYVKGVTTYRAGTMTTVLAAKSEEREPEEEIIKEDVSLPDSSPATVKILRAEQRKWYVTVVYYESNHRPFALFVQTNDYEKNVVAEEAVELLIKLARKKGIPKRHIDVVISKIEKDNNVNKVARLLSFVLRHGVLIKNIVATLDKVESAYAGSFVFAIKKFLGSYIKDGENVEDEKCMECGSDKIVFSEGCRKCVSCGSSKCG